MQFVWWALTILFAFFGFLYLIGIFNPNFFNKDLKNGKKTFTRKSASWPFIVCLLCVLLFASLASHNSSIIGSFLSIIGSFGFLIFIVLSITSRVRKTGRGKKRLLFAGALFVVAMIGGALTPAQNPSDSSVASVSTNTNSAQHPSADTAKKSIDQNKTSIEQNQDTASNSQETTSSPAVASNLVPAVVSKDVDGDTIKVTLNDKEETIRMLLIDTPEDVDPYKPVEPFAYQAADYAKSVLPVGKQIFLQEGQKGHERDKYNRLLAYVYITPTDMYNKDVVERGLARVAYIIPPNTDHLSELQAAQSDAQSKKAGIWSLAGYVTSDGYNLTTSCNYARNNGYSTRGCGAVPTKTTTSSSEATKPSSSQTSTITATRSNSSVSTSVSGSSLDCSPGDYASVSVKTKPGVTGTIEVIYNSGPSKAAGLVPETADSSGNITWTWKVGTRTAPGTYPVIITVNGSTITKTLTVN